MTGDRGQGPPRSLNRRASRRPGDSPSDASKGGEPADAVLNTAAGEGVAPPPYDPPAFRAAGGAADARGRGPRTPSPVRS